MNFQDWLTQQMKSYDLNQTGLALKLGVSQSVVSSWLRGLYTPSPENCRKLAQLFHVAPEDIFKLVGYMENTVNETATPYAAGTIKHRLLVLISQLEDTQAHALLMLLEAFTHDEQSTT